MRQQFVNQKHLGRQVRRAAMTPEEKKNRRQMLREMTGCGNRKPVEVGETFLKRNRP